MTRAQILGAVLLALLLAATTLAALRGGHKAEQQSPGFGRDWQCTPQPQGDPICIRVAPTPPARPTKP